MGKLILKNNGVETQLINGLDFTTITPESGKYVLGFDSVTGNLDSLDPLGNIIQYGEGGTFTGGTVSGATTFTNGLTANTITVDTISATTYLNISAGGLTNTDYSGLTSLILTSGLTAGSYYLITDFQTCYDQPDYDYDGSPIITGNYRTSEVDPIIVFATSNSTLAENAYQPSYPKDSIKYDITFTVTEKTGSPAKGRITQRIDEYNNKTDYDHRTVKFKRYTTNFLDNTINGVITGMTDGNVLGFDTLFTDLTIGEIIFIESDTPRFYKITNIISNTEMQVEGYEYWNFTNADGYRFWGTNKRVKAGSPGTLYYFNDVADGLGIDDGGNDMYDGGNYINTNLDEVPYTHTQMSDPPVNDTEQANISDFVMDGTVQNGDTYFGTG
jgi:hypothetical protein